MEWTFDKGLEAFASLGAEYAPGVVYVVRDGARVGVVAAEVGVGCVLTPQGATILSEIHAAAKPEVPKASKKPKKVVESANLSASVADDLDLDV